MSRTDNPITARMAVLKMWLLEELAETHEANRHLRDYIGHDMEDQAQLARKVGVELLDVVGCVYFAHRRDLRFAGKLRARLLASMTDDDVWNVVDALQTLLHILEHTKGYVEDVLTEWGEKQAARQREVIVAFQSRDGLVELTRSLLSWWVSQDVNLIARLNRLRAQMALAHMSALTEGDE